MSEDSQPPAGAVPEPPAARHPLAAAVAQNLHAILVGVFTLTSSIVSALLGYYFAHEDRKSMMQLEYDKLRAEHTLDVAKSIAAAEAHMISLSAEGSYALFSTCGRDEDIKQLAADVAKAKPLPPLQGSRADKLRDIEHHLRASDIEANARDLLLLRFDTVKANEEQVGESVATRLKSFDDLSRKLTGDTAATMHVYHRDRAEEYMMLVGTFLQVNGDARRLLWEMKCGSESKFDEIGASITEWNANATTFVQSLGIAIKPD